MVPAAKVSDRSVCSETPEIEFVDGFPQRLITQEGAFSIIGPYSQHNPDQRAVFEDRFLDVFDFPANSNDPLPQQRGFLHGRIQAVLKV